ncbi:MAG: ATP-dependent 6-phosphofructokinase 2 [Phycisphaerae bacterium]|nr:ATP-dependent 6-phosphofructokinase 2 [Phycisphaerae bacterium]
MGKLQRIGVLTGGGDCPGLNAVIRAVTKTAIFQHGLEVYGIFDGFLGLIENRMQPLTWQSVSNILTQGGTILGTSNKANPERFMTGKDASGEPIFSDVTEKVVNNVRSNKLDAIVVIGGDGTMSCAHQIIRRGIPCIGVPKTIDNDLMYCDVTFGFFTAVQTACDALDRIHTTASSHQRIMLVETMGRNAGWLALHAGMAGGADIILLPEIPFDIQLISRFCQDRFKSGKKFTIITVSEGAKPIGGQVVVDRIVKDSFEAIRLGGISNQLALQIESQTGIECRSTILGHVQRGGSPIAFDRILATQYGHKAIELLAKEQFNQLVIYRNGQIDTVPIAEVANRQRLVSLDHPLLLSAEDIGVCLGKP